MFLVPLQMIPFDVKEKASEVLSEMSYGDYPSLGSGRPACADTQTRL